MSRSARVGQAVLVLLGVLCTVIALSVFFVPDPFEPDAQALIGTFGAGMGLLVLVLATAGLASGQRWPWLALWLLPVFFLSHVALIGTRVARRRVHRHRRCRRCWPRRAVTPARTRDVVHHTSPIEPGQRLADELVEEALQLAGRVGGDAAVDRAGLEHGANAGP